MVTQAHVTSGKHKKLMSTGRKKWKLVSLSLITNQKTQRQTEAVAVTIIRPQGHCEHSIDNWDQTAFLHPSIF